MEEINERIYEILESKESLIKFFIDSSKHIVSKERLQEIESDLMKRDYNELATIFFSLQEDAKRTYPNAELLRRDMANTLNSGIKTGLFNDTALHDELAPITDKVRQKEILQKIRGSSSSDKVCLSYAEDMALWDLVKNKECNNIPSDLFFADTIPIYDLEIECDERGKNFNPEQRISKIIPNADVVKGQLIKYRVIIFQDAVETLKNKDILEGTNVGALIIDGFVTLYIPLYVMNGYDFMPIESFWADKKIPNNMMTNYVLNSLVTEYMSTWYSIQVSLLHPQIKEIYERPNKVPIHPRNSGKTKSRKVKYFRVHKLKLSDIENALSGEEKHINRKCLCWYVIGHWREYTGGKKVFIQGYWKGALRELKKNMDDGRERVIEKEAAI